MGDFNSYFSSIPKMETERLIFTAFTREDMNSYFEILRDKDVQRYLGCQTAHCGRYIPHFDFGAKPSPIVPYRHLPQSLSGMTADCRSLV